MGAKMATDGGTCPVPGEQGHRGDTGWQEKTFPQSSCSHTYLEPGVCGTEEGAWDEQPHDGAQGPARLPLTHLLALPTCRWLVSPRRRSASRSC